MINNKAGKINAESVLFAADRFRQTLNNYVKTSVMVLSICPEYCEKIPRLNNSVVCVIATDSCITYVRTKVKLQIVYTIVIGWSWLNINVKCTNLYPCPSARHRDIVDTEFSVSVVIWLAILLLAVILRRFHLKGVICTISREHLELRIASFIGVARLQKTLLRSVTAVCNGCSVAGTMTVWNEKSGTAGNAKLHKKMNY